MTNNNSKESNQNNNTSTQLFNLANKVLCIISTVIAIIAFIIISLVFLYIYLIFNTPEGMTESTNQLKDLILILWRDITPYVARFIQLVAPVFALIFALGLLHRLGSHGASPFDMNRLLSDLPSTLALLIIATICLLPLAGIEVPDVLKNIALVVVGFYFGKRKTSDE